MRIVLAGTSAVACALAVAAAGDKPASPTRALAAASTMSARPCVRDRRVIGSAIVVHPRAVAQLERRASTEFVLRPRDSAPLQMPTMCRYVEVVQGPDGPNRAASA